MILNQMIKNEALSLQFESCLLSTGGFSLPGLLYLLHPFGCKQRDLQRRT